MTPAIAVVRAVLWDADGVLQVTPPDAWDIAVAVVDQFPGALTGAPIDEAGIRAAAARLGLGDRADELISVWSNFDLVAAGQETVARVRAAGTPCYLASNQDAYRAVRMRQRTWYTDGLDGLYFSCDLGVAKPSAAYFEHIAADLGVSPDALLFLDDQVNNIEAARAVGLRAERWTHTEGIGRLHELLAAHGVPLAPDPT